MMGKHLYMALTFILASVLVTSTIQAQRFSACMIAWENPAVNADGSKPVDLAGVKLLASRKSGAQGDVDAVTIADVATTEPGSTETTPCAFPGDGRWYVVAVAYDSARPPNPTGPSNEIEVEWDHLAPGPVVIRIVATVSVKVEVKNK